MWVQELPIHGGIWSRRKRKKHAQLCGMMVDRLEMAPRELDAERDKKRKTKCEIHCRAPEPWTSGLHRANFF